MSQVNLSGPLFDGSRADEITTNMMHEIRADVSAQGKRLVFAVFAGSIKVEHGEFESSIKVINSTTTFNTHSDRRTIRWSSPLIRS